MQENMWEWGSGKRVLTLALGPWGEFIFPMPSFPSGAKEVFFLPWRTLQKFQSHMAFSPASLRILEL